MSLWNQEGIPHKGWTCRDMEDLGADKEHLDVESRLAYYEKCEMCLNEGIRYVHIMEHPLYHKELRVGQQCAENMENDYENPKKRESSLKNKAKRRANFLRQAWKTSSKGHQTLKYKGNTITIMESRFGGFGVVFNNKFNWVYKGVKIKTIENAKYVAFELLNSKTHT